MGACKVLGLTCWLLVGNRGVEHRMGSNKGNHNDLFVDSTGATIGIHSSTRYPQPAIPSPKIKTPHLPNIKYSQ